MAGDFKTSKKCIVDFFDNMDFAKKVNETELARVSIYSYSYIISGLITSHFSEAIGFSTGLVK